MANKTKPKSAQKTVVKKPEVNKNKAKTVAKTSSVAKDNAKAAKASTKSKDKSEAILIKSTSVEIEFDATVQDDAANNSSISSAKATAKKSKGAGKSKTKAKKNDKKQDDGFDDDIDDNFGDSEIAEYEEDLRAVEDDDEESLEDFTEDDDAEAVDTEIYLTDSEGRRLCRVRDCDQVSSVDGYCRYHYLLLWKKIQIRKAILQDGKLERYIVDLTSRYPDKFLEMIKKDLKTEKDFLSTIAELEIDESALVDESGDDDAQSFADEIRGTVDAPSLDEDSDY